MEMIKEDIKVVWGFQDEGWHGDYDEDDPEDEPLLRFYTEHWNKEKEEWEEVPKGSYCTQFADTASDVKKKEALEYLAQRLYDAYHDGTLKRTAQQLSWIGVDSYPI
jgi:hypothetical protein